MLYPTALRHSRLPFSFCIFHSVAHSHVPLRWMLMTRGGGKGHAWLRKNIPMADGMALYPLAFPLIPTVLQKKEQTSLWHGLHWLCARVSSNAGRISNSIHLLVETLTNPNPAQGHPSVCKQWTVFKWRRAFLQSENICAFIRSFLKKKIFFLKRKSG